MRRTNIAGRVFVLAACLVAAGLCRVAAAAEEQTVKAFAAWQGQGHVYETGPKSAAFVGALVGTMYVETDKGPLGSGRIVCPALLDINLVDNSQTGTGRCTITARDGARVYGDIACSGFHLIGCDGDFKVTGGTGRFTGITGGGRISIRSEAREISAGPEGSTAEQGSGIMYWRELRYVIP
jgi:hypothetical protein